MKKLLSMVLTLTLLMSSITAFAAVTKPAAIPETGVVFYEDFSGYDAANPNAALTANWGYGTSASIATENGNDYASSLNGYVFGDTLFGTTTPPISSGKLKISVDVRIPSTYAVGDGTYAITYADSWKDVFDPWAVVKTENGAAVYWAKTEHVNAKPAASEDTSIISTIDCDKWYNLAVVIDYSNSSRKYYLDNTLIGKCESSKNLNFLSLGLVKYVEGSGYSAELDNVKIERLVDVKTLPEIGILVEDNFEGYISDADALAGVKEYMTYAGGATLGTETGNKYASSLNGYFQSTKVFTKPSQPAVNSGKLKISFDARIPSTHATGSGSYMQTYSTDAWAGQFYPLTVEKTSTGAAISWGDNTYGGSRPKPTDSAAYHSTIDCDKWYNLAVMVDYDKKTRSYYLDDNLVATVKNAININFSSFGFVTLTTSANFDNLKVERFASDPVDPETFNSYTVTDSVPEIGLIMKDNFSDRTTVGDNDWKGMYYGSLGDIANEEGNKFLRTKAPYNVEPYFAYVLHNHVAGAEISTGRLSMTYKVRVNKSTNEQAADATNALYLMSWSKAGWAGDNSSRNYYNAVMYDNNKPYILWSTYANDGGITSSDEDGNNKMEIEFGTWNTVNVVVDYDNKIVEQFVNGDLKKSISVNDDTIKKFGIGVMTIGRKSAGNAENDEFNIDVDDLRIERLTAVVPDTVIKKDGTAITSNDVANLASTALTVEFTVAEAGSANIVIAAYKGEELIGIVTTQSPIVKGANSVELTTGANFAGAETVKAFVFDNFDNITPLAGAASYGK